MANYFIMDDYLCRMLRIGGGRLGDWATGRLGDFTTLRLYDWATGRLYDWATLRLHDFTTLRREKKSQKQTAK